MKTAEQMKESMIDHAEELCKEDETRTRSLQKEEHKSKKAKTIGICQITL